MDFENPPPLPCNQNPISKARSRACDARMEFMGTIHAAMGGLLNGSHVGVNIATGPRGALDLNAIEEHWAWSILVHPDKGSRKDAAIRQGRTTGREIRHHDVVHDNVDQKCTCMFLCFLDLASIIFLLARFGGKIDGHMFEVCFLKFFRYLGLPMQGLKIDKKSHIYGIIGTTMSHKNS